VARILAVDYGRRRIGIAVSDPLGITAQMRPALIVDSRSDALRKLKKVVEEHSPSCVVFGLPLDLHGGMGEMAEEVRAFGEELGESAAVAVEYFDERLTSRQAERAMHEMGEKTGKRKARVDSLSAVFILQGYLEFRQHRGDRQE